MSDIVRPSQYTHLVLTAKNTFHAIATGGGYVFHNDMDTAAL